jgi:hypothetical protein
MTLHDPTLLSAYLDGELDPDERSSVESALARDPVLAEDLQRLAGVRDLVAGLPRPATPVDLARALTARIDETPARWFRWPSLRSPRDFVPRINPGPLGIAASVLLALVLAQQAGKALRRPRAIPHPATPVLVANRDAVAPAPIETVPLAAPDPVATLVDGGAVAVVDPQPVDVSRTSTGDPAANASQRARDAERIRRMLDSPNLQRIFIVTDVLGGKDRDRVEELVEKTPRTEAAYGRITVTQGIVIDPLHPNQATVFALVMNDQELRHFERNLKKSFPDRVEETGADPAVVTQLADVGQVSVVPGTAASVVDIPADVSPRIALKSKPGRQGVLDERSQVLTGFGLPDLAASTAGGLHAPPIVEPAKDEPPIAVAAVEPPATGVGPSDESRPPESAEKPREPVGPVAPAPRPYERAAIVLVWVTSP